MKKLANLIIACLTVFLAWSQNEQVDHQMIKEYEYSHDLDLPDWGPYSKKYNGISHITSKENGYRFDLSFATGFFHRSKMVLPDVNKEQDYFIWDVDPDLKYLSYKYQLEWKDKVVCDVTFSEIDKKSRFITIKFENNTAYNQDVVYNLLASMNYPGEGRRGNKKPVLPVKVILPDDALWIDGMDYAEMVYATPRHDDNLIYDGFAKGEVYGSGMVNSRALGRDFGYEKGDWASFYIDTVSTGSNEIVIRYKTEGDTDAVFQAEGILQGEVVLEASRDFQLKRIKVEANKEKSLKLISMGNTAITLDGFAFIKSAEYNQLQFIQEQFEPVPDIEQGPTKNSLVLKYKNTDKYYGILWEGQEHYLVEIFSDNLAALPQYNNRNIDVPKQYENDNGHFTDVLVYGIELEAFEKQELNGLVYVGTKQEVVENLKSFSEKKDEFKVLRDNIYRDCFAGKQSDCYGFAMQRMESVMANNLVFPIICQNEYIKHYTPGRRWNSLYTWDVGMIGIGMAEIDINRSVNILNTYTTAPENPNAFIHHGTPAPTQIYQFLEIWNKTCDRQFLKHYYPRLKKYYQFLSGSYGSSVTRFKSGLTKTWDYFYNSAGWDDYPPQRWAEHHDKENLLSPAVSPSHLIRSAKILKMAAKELGLSEDIKLYDEDIKRTTIALHKYSWDEKSGYFSYVFHNEKGEALDILRSENGENMNMGMDGATPLFAGACNDHQRRLLIDKLLDKTRLWTKLGISVDQKAPHANVNAYSNETVWISHQWFFWKALLDLGLGQAAWEQANTALKVFSDETNRTYHCWEHYTQKSLSGTGWHQFSGLNAPLVSWYHIYFKPGNIYGGFDFWLKEKSINDDCSEASFSLELSELHRSESKTVLVSMNPVYNYQVKLNGREITFRQITETTLMIDLPAEKSSNYLQVIKSGKREHYQF